jgi:hypothetical protein
MNKKQELVARLIQRALKKYQADIRKQKAERGFTKSAADGDVALQTELIVKCAASIAKVAYEPSDNTTTVLARILSSLDPKQQPPFTQLREISPSFKGVLQELLDRNEWKFQ